MYCYVFSESLVWICGETTKGRKKVIVEINNGFKTLLLQQYNNAVVQSTSIDSSFPGMFYSR